MALAALKTWVAEKLFAADLNAEFSHIRNNALSLISPLTGALDFDGKELILDGDADTSITADTDDQIDFRIGGADDFQMTANTFTALAGSSIVQTDGTMFIGDTANTKMTIGLTIDKGTNTDEVIALKSDVAHSFTAETETDTFGNLQEITTTGGLLIQGFSNGAGTTACALQGHIDDTAVNDTTTTAGRAAIEMQSYVDDDSTGREGYSVASVTGNIFIVRDASLTQFIVKEDGEIASNLAATVFDDLEYGDVDAVRAFSHVVTPFGVVKGKWDHFVRSNEQTLVEMGILGAPLDQHPLYSVTKLQMLHNGAIWQLYTRHMDLQERYDTLEHKVLLLEGHA